MHANEFYALSRQASLLWNSCVYSHNGSQQIGFTFSHKKLNKNKKVAFCGVYIMWNVFYGMDKNTVIPTKFGDEFLFAFPIKRTIHSIPQDTFEYDGLYGNKI